MSDFAYKIVSLYFLALLAVFYSRFVNLKIGRFLAQVSASLSFLIVAFRPMSFPDVDSYETMFKLASTGEFMNPIYWLSHGEPGFKVMSFVLFKLGLGFQGFLFSMSALSCCLLNIISRKANLSFSYLWFIYFSFFFLTRDAGVIRLAISSHLIILVLLTFNFGTKIRLLFVSFSTFQYFSVIVVLGEIANRISPRVINFFALILVALVTSKFIDFKVLGDFFPEKQSKLYEGSYHLNGGFSPTAVIRNGIYFIIIYVLYYSRRHSHSILIWSAFLSLFMYIMFSGVLVLAQRFSAYFGAVIVLSLALTMNDGRSSFNTFIFLSIFAIVNFVSVVIFNDFIWR